MAVKQLSMITLARKEVVEGSEISNIRKKEKLRMAVTRLYLRPKITFAGDNIPDKTIIDEMHHRAHGMFYCELSFNRDNY